MHNNKLIKKIWGLARYDFMSNLTNWLTITGALATGVIVSFGLLTFATHSYQVPLWNLPNIMFHNLIDVFCAFVRYIYNNPFLLDTDESLAIIELILFALLPAIILQNSLDLAFDSTMSGFRVLDKLYEFCLAQVAFLIAHGLILWICMNNLTIIKLLGNYNLELAMQAILILSYFCILQTCYLVGLHILEYKKRLLESIKDVVSMMKHQQLLLAQIVLLQVLVTGIATAAIYFLLQPAVIFLVKFIFWPFSLLHIAIAPVFFMIMSNFFYCWTYMMLYAWICLVTAHLYRQLACPPSNNTSCSSCTSCESDVTK